MKRLNPIDGWQAALKKQGAHNIINGAKSALGFTILLRGVWARHAKNGTVREEERAGRGVVELATIVSLERHDRPAKLCLHKSMKRNKRGEDIGLAAKRERPDVMGVIIKHDKVGLET